MFLGFREEAGFPVFLGMPFGSLFKVILHPVLRLIGQNVPGDLKKGLPKTHRKKCVSKVTRAAPRNSEKLRETRGRAETGEGVP